MREQFELFVGTELDWYINMCQQGISDKNVKTFISHVLVPRLMTMKAILGGYEEKELTFDRRRELEREFMKTQEMSP